MKARLITPLLLILLLAGCYTNPVTGRSYAVLTSESEELQLGAQSFTDIKKAEKVSTDPAANARVRRVGLRIASVVGSQVPDAQWEFVVFDSPQINAFALPGGKVGVYTGLLKLAATDDELAIVMGHEIGHVVARHGGKRMTEVMMANAVGQLGSSIVQTKYGDDKVQIFQVAYGGLSQIGYVLPHSRADESEADLMGLQYAAQAGYDPRAAITFWEKMARATKGKQTPVWLSTHPVDAQRIADLKAAMPRYLPIYEANRKRYSS